MVDVTDCEKLLNRRNEMRGNGEDTSAIDQQLQACSLARGTWTIDANGTQGTLVIRTLDISGNVEGNILGDNFTGRWDTASRALTFSRPPNGVTPSQHYTGTSIPYVDPTTQVSESTLAGLLTEDAPQGSFGWFAQTTNIPDSLAPAPIPNGTYQDGAVVLYSQHSQLSDFDANSPTTVGAETVTSVAHASPDGTDNAFLWNVEQIQNEVGLHKDLSGSQARVFRHDIKIDSAATLSNEHTYFHAWTDHFKENLVQIRVAPRDGNGKGDFVFALRAPDSSGHFTLSQFSFDHFKRDQWYTVELYMNDIGFQLKAGPYGQPLSTIIDWYGVSDQFSNQGKFMGVISLSKFYSANFNGKYYVHAPKWLADYTYPIFPSSLAEQISGAWKGWKNRYLRSDGLVRRPNPQGKDRSLSLQTSDNVSEATAYGLLLAVQMNDPATFDLIYSYDKAHLQRSPANVEANPAAQNRDVQNAFHLSGWHYDDEHNQMYDFNFATDADIDKALALVWAARRKVQGHTGWVTSPIDYATEATQVISDLKNYCFRTVNGKAYQVSDTFQGNANPVEIDPSYLSVAAYTIFQNFTNDTFWANALSGAYDLLTKDTHATMKNISYPNDPHSNTTMTGVGYWSDWCGLDPATGNIVTPPNNRDIVYGYDAFRIPYRVYWDLIWNNSASAKTLLTGSIRQDFINMWNTSPQAIFAEIWYDGTVKGQYEKSMMTMAAYITLLAASSGDPTAAQIWSAKLAQLFRQNPGGEYFMDSPNTSGQFVGQPSYFSDSWMMIGMLLKNGTWQNF